MPFFFFDKLSDNAKKLYMFAVLFIGIASAMIVYANTVREDLGRVAPRLSFRYFGPIFVVVICVFVYLIQEIETSEIIKRQGPLLTFIVFISIAIFAVLKGVTIGSAVDQYVLEVYRELSLLVSNDSLPGLDNTDSIIFYTGPTIVNLLIIGWILICMFLLFNDKKEMVVFFTISICLVSLVNDVLVYRLIQSAYMLDGSIVEEAGAINSFFNESDVEKNVLYFTDSNSINKFSKAMDTYVDKPNLYYVDSKMLMDITAGESVKVSEIEFKEAIWGSIYEEINTADYIITEADTFTGITVVSNCEKVSNLPQNHFYVYKNLFPAVIGTELNHDLCFDGNLEMYFTGNLYNADHYVTYGISGMEDGFSWTDGDIMHVEIPCEMKEGIAEIRISIINTFNGEKAYSINGNGREITSGAIDGEGMISFREEIMDGMLVFDLNCENAEVVNQVIGGDDERKIAFAINNISVTGLK